MMPKKRVLPDDPESEDDDSSADEMEIEDEKEQVVPNSDDDEVPFLDTFYGLSSSSVADRAQAAHDLLKHCLLGPNSNTKDAAYALKRLFNGLCSGRASARQGYASALTSFLKIAFQQGMIDDIKGEYTGDYKDESALVFVRNRLLVTTDAKQAQTGKFGKKKGSEERDYCFGRIFGILGVIRSGIFFIGDSSSDLEEVIIGYTNDLVDLYKHKKWMREPAAQGILALLSSFPSGGDGTLAFQSVANKVVTQVIVPKLLIGENNSEERDSLLQQYTPEQIAVAVHVQANTSNKSLPFPLDEAVLSSDSMAHLSEALMSTSHVVHPRTHLVWDVIWSALTTGGEAGGSDKRVSQCQLREHAPASSESCLDVVSALFRVVVIESLLGASDSGKKSNTTHERRALALTLVKTLCGGKYKSFTAGTAVLRLDTDVLENVILCPVVVQRLFLDVIAAGGKPGSNHQQHMLKPLALHVLESVLPQEADDDADACERRLAFARALLRCDPRFDSRTKTRTVPVVLLLGDTVLASDIGDERLEARFSMWTKYLEFLKRSILESPSDKGEEPDVDAGSNSYQALGYVDLLYNAVKQILRVQSENDDPGRLNEFQSKVFEDTLGFLMASAFFDCSKISNDEPATSAMSSKKKKKRKKKPDKSESAVGLHPAVSAGMFIHGVLSVDSGKVLIPYKVRAALSSRFYSVLGDYLVAVAHKRASSSEEKDTVVDVGSKEEKSLGITESAIRGLTCLEERGAVSFMTDEESIGENDLDTPKAKKLVNEFMSYAKTVAASTTEAKESDSKAKFALRSAQLMTVLFLNLLSCGSAKEGDDEDDVDSEDDGDDDREDILEMISDLPDIVKGLLGESADEDIENPLLALAELSASILSSPLCYGSQTRGGSPKIIRESVKSLWANGLAAAALISSPSETKRSHLLNEEVVDFLLSAVGAADGTEGGEERENSADEMEEDIDSDQEDTELNSEEEVVFTAAAAEALDGEDDMDTMTLADNSGEGKGDSDDDVELDPKKLESLLLEDSDAELGSDNEGVLEHHAGADAALGKLIKLKQEARKAGKQAKEKLEFSNYLRCLVLIETIAVAINSSRSETILVDKEVALRLLVPLLRQRRVLEKSLASSAIAGKKGGADNEKRALVDRLTTLLKSKICKLRLSPMTCTNAAEFPQYVSDLASRILTDMKKSGESGHSSCCSSALVMTMRSIQEPERMAAAASVYGVAVGEWSTRRATRLNTIMFEDFIQQCPSLAQTALASPLITATDQARSPFLKTEAFRLLGNIFATAKDQKIESVSELESMGIKALRDAVPQAAKSFVEALQDDDMRKTKRIRDVLKAADKVVVFARENSMSSNEELLNQFQKLVEPLESLEGETESHAVKSSCEKISKIIKEAAIEAGSKAIQEKESSHSSKKSSKKKKKKKGKKK